MIVLKAWNKSKEAQRASFLKNGLNNFKFEIFNFKSILNFKN